MKRLFFSGGLFLLVSAGKAQETEVELNPVTVTASLNPVQVSQTGRNLLVIKGDRFKNLPVHSLDDLLRYSPGIEVQARGPMGSQSDFVIRGGTFQQLLVILDGVRVNDPNTGHFSSYIPIAPAEIERIEVLKGGSSALYGSDAVGGVIHVITKSFAAKKDQKKKEASAQLMAGEYNLLNVNAGGFFNNGKTAVSGGTLSNNTTGQSLRGIRGFVHANTASVSVQQQLQNNWSLALRSAYDNRDFAAQNFYSGLKLDTADEKVRTIWNQLRLTYQKKRDKVSFDVGYKNVQDEFRLNPSSLANNNQSQLWQALGIYEHQFSQNTILTSGAQYQMRKIKSNDRGNHQVDQAAVFTSFQQTIGTSFHLNPALRVDWNQLGGTELVPQINLSYNLGAVQLRGSAGKTIRYADFTEQYNNYNKPPFVGSGNRIGNPNLEAERSFSYEAGSDWMVHKYLKVSATYFQRDYKKLIDFVLTPYQQMPRQENLAAGGSFYLAQNIAALTTRGFETDIQFSKQLAQLQSIFSNVGLVWLNSKNDQATPSLYISMHAKFLANFSVQYKNRFFSLGFNGLYKKRNPQVQDESQRLVYAKVNQDYFVLNGKAEAFVWKRKLSVVAQVDNIFDRQYSDVLGALMPQRWLMGGIKVTL